MFSVSQCNRMINKSNELSQDTEPQTSFSEVVEVWSWNAIKAQPKRKPRQPKHLTVEQIRVTILVMKHHSMNQSPLKKLLMRRKPKQKVEVDI